MLACAFCRKPMPPNADFGDTWSAHGEVVCCGDPECRAAEDAHYAAHWRFDDPLPDDKAVIVCPTR